MFLPLPRCFVSSLFACGLAVMAGAAEPGVRILSLEPTVLFPRREPLAQIARLTVVNPTGAALRADAVITIRGGATETSANLELAPNQSTIDVLVPDIGDASGLRVELRQAGTVVATHEQTWQPQRKWTVYMVKSSHEDIGYENFIFTKQKEIADFIDLARESSSPHSVINAKRRGTEGGGYRYTLETLLFQRNYLEERGEAAWRRLVEQEIKPGYMPLMGAPSGVHTHWMDYEELARVGYPAQRESRDRFGLGFKTFMIVDNPSLSWSGAQALADSGFKYVARWGQPWRTGGNNDYATTKLPALFWWEGPDGASRVLFTWRSHYSNAFWMGQTGTNKHKLELGAQDVTAFLKQVEAGAVLGPYPYDALITPEYSDHALPYFSLSLLPSWAERYAYPKITLASADDFFAYIETKYGATLPVLRGDLNNFSADYAAIDPESQDWKRRAARLLPAAEGLGVIAGSADAGFALSLDEVERTYTRLFDYDEHSWPTQPPETDAHLFNASWVKKQEGRRALDHAEALFARAAGALGAQIASPGAGTFAVYNPLVHARSGRVEIAGHAAAVTDLRTGASVPTEPAGEGRVAFQAPDLPALGYALFRPDPAARPAAPAPELQAEALAISNRYYTVRFHPENGAVVSIVERGSGRELIDASAPYLANQLVHVHKHAREAKEGYEYTPAKATTLTPRLGVTSVSFETFIEDAKLGGTVRQTVTLRAGVKQVEFVNRLESIDVMHSRNYADRYCENIYYAFPFAVAGGQIRAEYPGGVVRPYDDQLRWGSHDYLYANRWIDVSNAQGGVTLASREAGTFSLGEIRYNQFAIDYKPAKPWLFNYAWSNRMAGLLTLQRDDCDATFTYTLTSHDGDWNSGPAAALGWETGSPLLVVPVTGGATAPWKDRAKSFLGVSAGNIQLTVLKSSGVAGRGWVARFVETAGKATEFDVDVSALGVKEAALTNLVEDETGALTVKDGKVRVAIRPFGFATVRLGTGAAAPGAVTQLAARAVTDAAARLTWSGPAGAAYNVYRSDDPDAPATAYSLIARTTQPELADAGLSLATKYYYRVAAVNAANFQGPVSAPLVVETTAVNRTAPPPVHEFGIVRRAADTLLVYWRKSPAPDVARYRVFRGETADFSVANREPVAVLEATPYFLQLYRDSGLQPGRTYYYRVQPVDWAGNLQPDSPLAHATTPKAD